MKQIIYIKPTERCNISCLHCYNEKESIDLSMKDYDDFLLNYSKYLCTQELNDFQVEFVFHGGEPTLVGIDVLREFIDRTENSLVFNKPTFSIQTNLITEDIDGLIQLSKDKMGGIIGMSLSPGLRNLSFRNEKLFEKNMKVMSESGIKIYAVVTLSLLNEVSPLEMIDLLLDYNVYGFHFEPLTKNGSACKIWDDIALSPDSYDSYKEAFAIEFIDNRIYEKIHLSDVVRKAKTFIDGKFVGCANRNCMRTVITLNSDGTLGLCPNTSKSVRVSDVRKPFEDFLDSDVRWDMISKEKEQSLDCICCAWFDVCNGGCCQTDGCYEGINFFSTLNNRLETNDHFREFVKNYVR